MAAINNRANTWQTAVMSNHFNIGMSVMMLTLCSCNCKREAMNANSATHGTKLTEMTRNHSIEPDLCSDPSWPTQFRPWPWEWQDIWSCRCSWVQAGRRPSQPLYSTFNSMYQRKTRPRHKISHDNTLKSTHYTVNPTWRNGIIQHTHFLKLFLAI